MNSQLLFVSIDNADCLKGNPRAFSVLRSSPSRYVQAEIAGSPVEMCRAIAPGVVSEMRAVASMRKTIRMNAQVTVRSRLDVSHQSPRMDIVSMFGDRL